MIIRNNLKREGLLVKVFATLITSIIILIVFFSGPAQAYVLSLSASNISPNVGDIVKFKASLKIDSNELLNISYLTLKLKSTNPSVTVECKFLPNGTIISGCTGITIVQDSSTHYGYGYNNGTFGYGYKPGTLGYNITLDTKNYSPGKYNTFIDFIIGNKHFEKAGEVITIKKTGTGPGKPLPGNCRPTVGQSLIDQSIRGREGTLLVTGVDFSGSTNKLTLSLPSRGATRGSGSITVQKNRNRFSYSFKVTNIEESNDQTLVYVKGTYRLGTGKAVPLETVLTIDKKTAQASFNAGNISLSGMNLVFNGRGC